VSRSTRRALIVDDDEGIRLVLGRIVRKAGYLAAFVSNARDALKQIGAAAPDMIFADMHMAKADGVELINWLRRHSSSIPLVAMSGSNATLTGELRLAAKLGARATVAKPLVEEAVLAAIRCAIVERLPRWPGQRWT